MAKQSAATTRLTGIAALEHAARTGEPLRRRWSLLSLGGEIDLEDAFRVARDSSPEELYTDVVEERPDNDGTALLAEMLDEP